MNRRGLWLTLMVLGLGTLVLSGVIMVSAATSSYADPPNLGAAYIGSNRCDTCHNDEGAAIWDAWAGTMHAQTVRRATADTIWGDLTDTEALTVTWPDGETRPITADDITYAIGGRYIQQYVSVQPDENGDLRYYVLPVVWNVPQRTNQEGAWSAYHPQDWTEPERDWRRTCAGCHTTGLTRQALEDGTPLATLNTMLIGDVEIGVGCEACHGPAGDHDGGANPLPRTPDAQVCAQCHTRGLTPEGDHPFPLDYQPGLAFDEMVFVMAASDDPEVFWATGHARGTNSQYNEWTMSAHAASLVDLQASDLAEDSCLRCHGAPLDSTDLTPEGDPVLAEAQFGVTCVACHNPHGVRTDSAPRGPFDLNSVEEAAFHTSTNEAMLRVLPPSDGGAVWQEGAAESPAFLLRAEPYDLCTSCHNSATPEGELLLVGGGLHNPVKEMFEGAELVETVPGYPATHFTARNGPDCMTCHMPDTVPIGAFGGAASHLLRPILPGDTVAEDDVDPANIPPDACSSCHGFLMTSEDIATFIAATQASFRERLETAQAAVEDDTEEWVQLAISFVEGDGSLGIHNYRYADDLMDAVDTALGIYARAAAEEPEEEPPPRTIIDDINDRFDTTGLVLLGLGALGLLAGLAAYVIRRRGSWLRVAGPLAFLLGLVLIVVAVVLPVSPHYSIAATGENSYCAICHARTDWLVTLADGSTLNVGIDFEAQAASVHGDSYAEGSLGCLDCHGEDQFPHEGPPPTGRRAYRLEMSAVCEQCHTDVLAHYNEYLDRGFPVGCTDCHTAHYVQPINGLRLEGVPSR